MHRSRGHRPTYCSRIGSKKKTPVLRMNSNILLILSCCLLFLSSLCSAFPTSGLLSKRVFDFCGFPGFSGWLLATCFYLNFHRRYHDVLFVPSYDGLQYTGIYWALGRYPYATFPSLLATNSGRIGTSPVLAENPCTNCCFFLRFSWAHLAKPEVDLLGPPRTTFCEYFCSGLVLEVYRIFVLHPSCLFMLRFPLSVMSRDHPLHFWGGVSEAPPWRRFSVLDGMLPCQSTLSSRAVSKTGSNCVFGLRSWLGTSALTELRIS